MRPASYIRRRGFVARACVVLLLVSALALFFCLGVGSAGYALNNVWQSLAAHLSGGEADATAELVLWRIRLPRSLLAYLVGAALAVSGAQIVLFTTGRGTPFASPVPTVKISSNSQLAGRKDNWIDFNAGRMVEDKSKEELAMELFRYVLEVASGRKVKAEEAGFHDMAIFKQGVTL